MAWGFESLLTRPSRWCGGEGGHLKGNKIVIQLVVSFISIHFVHVGDDAVVAVIQAVFVCVFLRVSPGGTSFLPLALRFTAVHSLF